MKTLLDFIAAHESEGAARKLGISAYDVVWGGIKAKDRPPRPLTTMTIGEVLAWQDSIDRLYQSEAAGRYQIMEDTLRGLYAEADMRLTDLFDRAGQDKLAVALLNRRGLSGYLSGALTAETFANNLAREWASLPVVTGPKKGKSYYAGDGLNAAGVSVKPFLAAIEAIKAKPLAPTPVAASPTPDPVIKPAVEVPAPTGWGAIIAALAAFIARMFKGA